MNAEARKVSQFKTRPVLEAFEKLVLQTRRTRTPVRVS